MPRTLALLLALCAAAAGASDTVTVYQLAGNLQCSDSNGVPAERAADLLRAQGVKVISAVRRDLPAPVASYCGAPTGEANVITVAAADWTVFTAQNPDAGGYGLWVFDQDTVEVYKYDGTLQCGMGQEIALGEMAKQLTAAGIEVLDSRKGNDGLAHIAVCGASTGSINVYTIRREQLPAAREAGFRMLVSREMTRRIKPGAERGMAGVQASAAAQAGAADARPTPVLW